MACCLRQRPATARQGGRYHGSAAKLLPIWAKSILRRQIRACIRQPLPSGTTKREERNASGAERDLNPVQTSRQRHCVTGRDLFHECSHENFGYFLEFFPKSGVNFVIFVQICPKIDICSQNLCSSRSNFTKVASAFQRFQPVNSTQYLPGLLSNEGRVD